MTTKTITIKSVTFTLIPAIEPRYGLNGFNYSFVHPAGHTCTGWVNESYVDSSFKAIVKRCEQWVKMQNRNS